MNDLEALEQVHQRFPTLVWDDYDGSVLVHSSVNSLRTQLEVMQFNKRLESNLCRIKQMCSRVGHIVTTNHRSRPRESTKSTRVRFINEALEIPSNSEVRLIKDESKWHFLFESSTVSPRMMRIAEMCLDRHPIGSVV